MKLLNLSKDGRKKDVVIPDTTASIQGIPEDILEKLEKKAFFLYMCQKPGFEKEVRNSMTF